MSTSSISLCLSVCLSYTHKQAKLLRVLGLTRPQETEGHTAEEPGAHGGVRTETGGSQGPCAHEQRGRDVSSPSLGSSHSDVTVSVGPLDLRDTGFLWWPCRASRRRPCRAVASLLAPKDTASGRGADASLSGKRSELDVGTLCPRGRLLRPWSRHGLGGGSASARGPGLVHTSTRSCSSCPGLISVSLSVPCQDLEFRRLSDIGIRRTCGGGEELMPQPHGKASCCDLEILTHGRDPGHGSPACRRQMPHSTGGRHAWQGRAAGGVSGSECS